MSSMVGVLLILAFTSHVSYLTFVSFDYGYNMAANATIGTTNAPINLFSIESFMKRLLLSTQESGFLRSVVDNPAFQSILLGINAIDQHKVTHSWEGNDALF